MQTLEDSDHPLLYAVRGFKYCDLLLASPELATWQETLRRVDWTQLAAASRTEAQGDEEAAPHVESCRAVSQRASRTLEWVTDGKLALLTMALDRMTLGRAALYEAVLGKGAMEKANSELDISVKILRRASRSECWRC